MSILNTIIEQASNIWWGIVVAIILVAVLYFIIYIIISGKKQFSLVSYAIAIPLTPILAFQMFLLLGSISLKHRCTNLASWIDAFVPEQTFREYVSRENINEIVSRASTFFPLVNEFIDDEIMLQEQNYSLGEALTHKTQKYLNWYIVRRLAWSLGFVFFAVVAIIFSTHRNSWDVYGLEGTDDIEGLENMDDLGTTY